MTNRTLISSPTSNVVIDGRDEGADGDGFSVDNTDLRHSKARYFAKGVGAVLGRSTKPTFNHGDMPEISNFEANFCRDGVLVGAVDWRSVNNTIWSVTGCGFDVRQGAFHDQGSKVSNADIGARIRPGVGNCDFQNDEMSDCRIGMLIQGNETTVANWKGTHNSQCGMLVGAKSLLSALRVNTDRDILSIRQNRKPATCIDFANRNDAEFGGLCGNWSTLDAAHFDILPGDTAIVANAHLLTLDNCHVNGEPDATALLIDQPIDNAVINLTVCGPAVIIRQLGSNCRIDIRYHQMRPRIEWPNSFNSTNRLTENGVEVKQAK